jgi:hypothetical protein
LEAVRENSKKWAGGVREEEQGREWKREERRGEEREDREEKKGRDRDRGEGCEGTIENHHYDLEITTTNKCECTWRDREGNGTGRKESRGVDGDGGRG